jgi:patatin-like phospholipase
VGRGHDGTHDATRQRGPRRRRLVELTEKDNSLAGQAAGPVKRFLLGIRAEQAKQLPGLIEEPERRRIGICLSGGGIRSAAFNLGALQILREREVLKEADYLTAVSGGSYIAAAHSIVYGQTQDKTLFAELPPYAPGSPEETWLRNRSNYIAPGASGKVRALARLLAGMATNVILVGIFLYLTARPLGWGYDRWVFSRITWNGLNPLDTIPRWAWLAFGVPAATGALFGWTELLFRPRESWRRFLSVWTERFFKVAAAPLIFLVVIPYLVLLVRNYHVLRGVLALADRAGHPRPSGAGPTILLPALGSLGLAALRALWAKKRSLLALTIATVIGPLTLTTALIWFIAGSRAGAPVARDWWIWLGLATPFAGVFLWSDLTNWSGHPFYKRRLWSAFAVRRLRRGNTTVAEEVPYQAMVRLSQAQVQPKPILIVCAAANVSTSGLTPPGRNAISFTFSAEATGMPDVGMVSTAALEAAMGARGRDLTLMSAMAISGAAISPSMGKMTRKPLTFLLALLNVRLGVWLPNPLRQKEWASRGGLTRLDRPRLHYLVKELFGVNSIEDKFLYVTDGGHFENLGLVELLRRGCNDIYCFDASGDLDETFYTLGEAIAIARTDLRVQIDIDPTSMCPKATETGCDDDKLPPTEHVVGSILYPGMEPGNLVFVKAAVTPQDPWDIRAFRQKDKRFPHHKTLDQLFNEEKFRAYWELGRHAAERAIKAMVDARRERPNRPIP